MVQVLPELYHRPTKAFSLVQDEVVRLHLQEGDVLVRGGVGRPGNGQELVGLRDGLAAGTCTLLRRAPGPSALPIQVWDETGTH